MKQTRNHALMLLLQVLCFFSLVAHGQESKVPIGLAARKLLEAHDFAALETMTGHWLSDYRQREITGDALYDTFDAVLPEDGLVGGHLGADLGAWRQAYPKSYAANYLLGNFLVKKAWEVRGTAFASKTSDKQFAGFRELVDDAEFQLLRSAPLFDKPYPTYCELTILERTQPDPQNAKYFRIAQKIDPLSFRAYALQMRALAPKWNVHGGKNVPPFKDLEDFVAYAKAAQTPPDVKARIDALYFEIKADDAENSNRYQDAVTWYKQSYEAAPGPSRLWRLTRAAEVAGENGMNRQATEIYAQVLGIDNNNVRARSSRGYFLETVKGDALGAIADYKVAGDGGDDWALNRLGWIYMDAHGVPRDEALAAVYLKRAAAMGNTTAVHNLKVLDDRHKH